MIIHVHCNIIHRSKGDNFDNFDKFDRKAEDISFSEKPNQPSNWFFPKYLHCIVFYDYNVHVAAK